jgi:hypothetical protein
MVASTRPTTELANKVGQQSWHQQLCPCTGRRLMKRSTATYLEVLPSHSTSPDWSATDTACPSYQAHSLLASQTQSRHAQRVASCSARLVMLRDRGAQLRSRHLHTRPPVGRSMHSSVQPSDSAKAVSVVPVDQLLGRTARHPCVPYCTVCNVARRTSEWLPGSTNTY